MEQRQARRFVVDTRKANDRKRQQVHRAFTSNSFLHLAFEYVLDVEYYDNSKVEIGAMTYRQGIFALNEPAGMCLASLKVQLPEIETPPEPLNGLLIGNSDYNLFLS